MNAMVHMLPALLLLPIAAAGTSAIAPQMVENALAGEDRPGGLPDRIVLTPGADASTGMAVTWRTDLRETDAAAQIAPSIGSSAIEMRARDVHGTTKPVADHGGAGLYHAVRFTGLMPGKPYVYRLRGAEGWSEWLQFRTADRGATGSVRLLYLGDVQNHILAKASRTIRSALLRAAPDLVLHAGDMTETASDREWGEWVAAGGFAYAMVPQLPAAGNHEYLRDADGQRRRLGPLWSAQFALPENGVAAGAAHGTSYYVDYHGARIVALDGTAALGLDALAAQAEWLDRVLADSPARWKIVLQHQPVYSCSRKTDAEPLLSAWVPIFRKRRVDLVLQGHDHCYSRISESRGKTRRKAGRMTKITAGPVYLVSVAGPKMYALTGRKAPTPDQIAADTQLYQTIDLTADRLSYRAYTATGDLYDSFDLDRAADGTTQLSQPRALPTARTCREGTGPDGGRCLGS
ncbi:metallophosphoesterase family protein [Sphingomonadaceae bacterium jetA1]|jgi:3',5'-cyclic AMP phosphodiesterase CpdA|uniref:metallophosphoesterase n=1 Tax=Facivitalis istanbulensis TaxID=3075838 RepID=UPI003474DDB2